MNMTGGILIRESRRRASISQSELARRLESHQSVVARWETGATNPDYDTVVKAVRATGHELVVSISRSDDHDLTLIRRELRLDPHERMTRLVGTVNALMPLTRIAQ
jgi:predicted transcriptional regulator